MTNCRPGTSLELEKPKRANQKCKASDIHPTLNALGSLNSTFIVSNNLPNKQTTAVQNNKLKNGRRYHDCTKFMSTKGYRGNEAVSNNAEVKSSSRRIHYSPPQNDVSS